MPCPPATRSARAQASASRSPQTSRPARSGRRPSARNTPRTARSLGPAQAPGPLRLAGVGRIARLRSPRARRVAAATRSRRSLQHLAGGLGGDREHPDDPAVGVPDRALREGEVALLGIPVAVQDHLHVLRADRPPAEHDLLDDRAGSPPMRRARSPSRAVPNARGCSSAPSSGMIGVVVDHHDVGPPGHHHGERRIQAEFDEHPQERRPSGERAERSRRPVHRSAPFTHLTGSGERRRSRTIRRVHRLSLPRVVGAEPHAVMVAGPEIRRRRQ